MISVVLAVLGAIWTVGGAYVKHAEDIATNKQSIKDIEKGLVKAETFREQQSARTEKLRVELRAERNDEWNNHKASFELELIKAQSIQIPPLPPPPAKC